MSATLIGQVTNSGLRERVDTLEKRVDTLVEVNHRQYKALDEYLGLVQAAYDYNAETGEWVKPKRELDLTGEPSRKRAL